MCARQFRYGATPGGVNWQRLPVISVAGQQNWHRMVPQDINRYWLVAPLIRGFGVRVPDGAPVLTCAFFRVKIAESLFVEPRVEHRWLPWSHAPRSPEPAKRTRGEIE